MRMQRLCTSMQVRINARCCMIVVSICVCTIVKRAVILATQERTETSTVFSLQTALLQRNQTLGKLVKSVTEMVSSRLSTV